MKKNTRKARNTRNTLDQLLYPLVSFQVKKINKKIKKILRNTRKARNTRNATCQLSCVLPLVERRILIPLYKRGIQGDYKKFIRAGHRDSARGGKIQFPHEQEGFSTVPEGSPLLFWLQMSIQKIEYCQSYGYSNENIRSAEVNSDAFPVFSQDFSDIG